jgi:hypothetical protein
MSARLALLPLGLSVGLIGAMAGAVLADTTDGSTDRWSASAFVDDGSGGGSNVGGIIDADLGTLVDYSFFRVTDVACDDGSSSQGSIDFSGQSAGTVAIDKKLAKATGSGTVSGSLNTFDPCTGETTSVDASYAVSFTLTANAPASSSVNRSKETLPDGSKIWVTTSITTREASGSFRIDGGTSIVAHQAGIEHLVVTTRPR